MPKHHSYFFLSPALLLLASIATVGAFVQESSSIPLVYSVENTAAIYPPPAFPAFAQLPIIRPLTDPFRFADGRRDTSFASWERRRSEIRAAIEKYEIGPKPDCSDCSITAAYTPPAAGSLRGTLSVVVTRNGKSLTLTSAVYLPPGMGSGPFPALISMTWFPFGTAGNYGSLPAEVFTSRPIATVDFVHDNVSTYGASDHANDPFYQLYPELCAGTCNGNVSNSGQYAAWSWGVSRLIDGLEIAARQADHPLPIDLKRLAVTGCSYAGKMALFAGALDERVALTIPQESGGGGAPAWRITHEIEAYGASEDIERTNYSWFGGQMRQFSGDNGYKLPTDHHELMALVAPRALLVTGNTDFYWLSNRANYITARATQRVYRTLGIGDRFGFYLDGGHGHCATLPEEAPVIAAFVDKFLIGEATASTDVQVNPYPALDYSRWTAWWGRDDSPRFEDAEGLDSVGEVGLDHWNRFPRIPKWPKFPDDWNPGDGSIIISSMTHLLDVNPDDTVMAGYALSMPGSHPATTVSLTGGNVQMDVSCPDGSSYILAIPLPDQAYSILADDDSWLPSPDHKSSLVYQGSAPASGCSGGVAKRAYFSALGVSPGNGNPPAAPGFSTTETGYPLKVRFHVTKAGDHGAGGRWSPAVTVNYNQ